MSEKNLLDIIKSLTRKVEAHSELKKKKEELKTAHKAMTAECKMSREALGDVLEAATAELTQVMHGIKVSILSDIYAITLFSQHIFKRKRKDDDDNSSVRAILSWITLRLMTHTPSL